MSFAEAEGRLQEHARTKPHETIWFLLDGCWYEVRGKTREHGISYAADPVESLIRASKSASIFMYHTHPRFQHDSYSGINPPSGNDLLTHALFKRLAAENSTNFISRVVDPFGVWQYDTDPKVSLPGDSEVTLETYADMNPFDSITADELVTALKLARWSGMDSEHPALIPLYRNARAEMDFRLLGRRVDKTLSETVAWYELLR